MKSKIRAASETHICDPEVCQAGVCAVGAQYVVELIPKGESTSVLERKGLVAFLKEKGWSRS